MHNSNVFLIILDGWGLGQIPEADAIAQAKTPFTDQLFSSHPHSTLTTFGEEVGLPEGQMGNSEVGHLNIGAGRIVYQELARINKAIRDKELHTNPILIETLQKAKKEGKKVHFMGLLSDGGVHSHINHLKALCDICNDLELQKVFIHAFMDGRDTDPKSGLSFLNDLQNHIQKTPIQIASAIGRYFAMDRDNRWERIKKAYDLMVKGIGQSTTSPETSLKEAYDKGETDEFIQPLVVTHNDGTPVATLENGDVLICFNFRTDRPREISEVLTQKAIPEFEMSPLQLDYVTMTRYDDSYKNVKVLFTKDDISNTLGEVISNVGKTQVRIAETEKYPHVTFFFSGGRENPFPGEKRILIPSPKVATYDLQPSMSAEEITSAIEKELTENQPNFICLNYANADMVGHTGDFNAAIKAVETVDECLASLVPHALQLGYDLILIADHGNSDYMINPDQTPNTAHTTNPVPFVYVSGPNKNITAHHGKLGDIAPTILRLMGIPIPKEMTGINLLTES